MADEVRCAGRATGRHPGRRVHRRAAPGRGGPVRAVRLQPVRGARRDPGAGQRGAGGRAAAPGARVRSSRSRRRSRSPRCAGCSRAHRGPGGGAGHAAEAAEPGRSSRRWGGGRRPSYALQRRQRPPARADPPDRRPPDRDRHPGAPAAQMVRHQFALALVPGGPRCRWPSTSASSRPSSPGTRRRPRRPCWSTSPA